jgi:hypothetical protein
MTGTFAKRRAKAARHGFKSIPLQSAAKAIRRSRKHCANKTGGSSPLLAQMGEEMLSPERATVQKQPVRESKALVNCAI